MTTYYVVEPESEDPRDYDVRSLVESCRNLLRDGRTSRTECQALEIVLEAFGVPLDDVLPGDAEGAF